VRFAGEDDLHRAPGIHEQALQPVASLKDQVGPLVRRKAGVAETNRQGLLIEQRPGTTRCRASSPLIARRRACSRMWRINVT